jgi:hypothetical protein
MKAGIPCLGQMKGFFSTRSVAFHPAPGLRQRPLIEDFSFVAALRILRPRLDNHPSGTLPYAAFQKSLNNYK